MEIPSRLRLAPEPVHSECGLSSQNQSLRDGSSLNAAGRLVLQESSHCVCAQVFRGAARRAG